MDKDKIQTLHPDPSKTNKRIDKDKYDTIRASLLSVLKGRELTDHFKGGVQWYGETVKLDLEARNLIERTGKKPEKYRVSTLQSKGDKKSG